jgi:hypothetical protein
MICYVIIFCSLILNLIAPTHDDNLYPKCLLCIYVLPEDDPRRSKHVGEIIIKKNIFMHENLELVGINTV